MKHLFLAGNLIAGLLLTASCSPSAEASASAPAVRTVPSQTGSNGYRAVKNLAYYPAGWKVRGDAAYAAERCKLDLYIPAKITKPVPVLIFFHGGGLSRGSKSFPRWHKTFPAEFIIVTPNYRLSGPRAKCPDYLNDAAAAAAWTVRNIQQYGGDPKLIFVTGHSAGGYLSAMIGLDPRWMKPFGLDPRKCFAGVMPVSGQMSTHFQVMKERGMAGRTMIDEFAPIHHSDTDTAPIVLFCGQHDIEFKARVAENLFFHAVLTQLKNNPEARIHQINGFNHGTVSYPAAYLLRQEMNRIIKQRKSAEKSARKKISG